MCCHVLTNDPQDRTSEWNSDAPEGQVLDESNLIPPSLLTVAKDIVGLDVGIRAGGFSSMSDPSARTCTTVPTAA